MIPTLALPLTARGPELADRSGRDLDDALVLGGPPTHAGPGPDTAEERVVSCAVAR